MSDFFEDLVVGTRLDLGQHTFTRDEILAFARQYDPQPFHLDDAAAALSPLGGLAASGWHTAVIWMKLYVVHRQAVAAALAARGEAAARPGPSPGFQNLEWRKPVLAGHTIRYASTITGKRTTSKPAWGLVFHNNIGINQDDEVVIAFDGAVFWERRREQP